MKALRKLSRKLAEWRGGASLARRNERNLLSGDFFDNFLLRLLLAKESGKRFRRAGRRGRRPPTKVIGVALFVGSREKQNNRLTEVQNEDTFYGNTRFCYPLLA